MVPVARNSVEIRSIAPLVVQIRAAAAVDAPALNRLMRESAACQGKYRAFLQGDAVSAEQIRTSHFYVAEQEDVVLGFYSLVHDESGAELDLFFVSDDAQGRGVGTALFRHMRDRARAFGCRRVMIVAHPPAEPFYRRMGAVRIATKLPAGLVTWPRPLLVLPVA